jgi:Na+/proline symporter
MAISFITGKDADEEGFFLANRKSPWYVVAFGMIGASLSGATFISVPGWVEASQWSYMQMVIGYIVGYMLIATVLMPLYYRMGLTSIYSYLESRFGHYSYRTGASYFLLSRVIGSSFRLYLVAIILHEFVLGPMGFPFWSIVLITIALIWIYTVRGGLKTIIWTDVLQTTFMILAVIFSVWSISQAFGWNLGTAWNNIIASDYSQIYFFENGWSDNRNFFKQFLAGASIALVMTGLDQDMMQKNLTCRNISDAQKNMYWLSITLVFVNLLFLSLGALLYIYSEKMGIPVPEKKDLLFPNLAINHLGPATGFVFIIGLIAAAYSSADSALTSLTTSFCVDFLDFNKKKIDAVKKRLIRYRVHIGFSVILFIVILVFWYINDDSVISAIFRVAGYTYGPLLGLFAFGLFNSKMINDKLTPLVCILAPILTFLLSYYSEELFMGYRFGFELLILNGLLTYLGLWFIRRR